MDVSVCIPCYNQAPLLDKTLASIFTQEPLHSFEVIVCNHGSTDGVESVLEKYPVKVVNRTRVPGHVNAGLARNFCYRAARGDICLINSADIVHVSPDSIDKMAQLAELEFNVASVWGLNRDGSIEAQYTGTPRLPPLCCLMAVWRRDIYDIGGDDEDFVDPAYDDYWLADRLMRGRNCKPVFRDDVVAHHQWHDKTFQNQAETHARAKARYDQKYEAARMSGNWCAPSGPWSMEAES